MEGEFTSLEHRATGLLYITTGVLGIAANIFIILTFLRGKPLESGRSNLHIHIAIGNLMIVAGCLFSGISSLAGQWLFGELGCKMYGLLTFTGGIGAVTLVMLLSVERFLDTVCSQMYAAHCGSLSSYLAFFGWTYSFLMSLAPLLGWNRYVIESSGTACGLDWADGGNTYFIVLPLVTLFMLVVALACLGLAHLNTDQSNDKVSSANWFSAYQLNWISTALLAMALMGFGPYGFMCVWTIFNTSHKMTMLASVIPPLVAKFSCIFYLVPYMVASKRFRSALTGGTSEVADDSKKSK